MYRIWIGLFCRLFFCNSDIIVGSKHTRNNGLILKWCHHATTSAVHTCTQDLANQIRYSEEYVAACKAKKVACGRYLNIHAGEFLSGLPRGWTSPRVGAVDVDKFHAQFPKPEAGWIWNCCQVKAPFACSFMHHGVFLNLRLARPGQHSACFREWGAWMWASVSAPG